MRSVHSFEDSAPRLRPRRLVFLSAAPLLLLPLALLACDSSVSEHPTGKADIVLRVETGGGFVTPQYNLTRLPEFTLYGDGNVIVNGPMIEIYPQPAMPNLQTAAISQADVARVLLAAKDAGLFANNVDYGQPGITDVGTTTITINADGKNYTSSIYALGFEQMPEGGTVDGLTTAQVKARNALTAFTAKTGDLDTFLGTTLKWQQYAYTSLAVFSQVADPANPIYDTTEVQPNRLEWPLADLSTMGEAVQPEGFRKAVVTGDDLAKLQPLLSQATQITLWKSGDHEYYLSFRPLLPDENAK
jgi:phage tail protein X